MCSLASVLDDNEYKVYVRKTEELDTVLRRLSNHQKAEEEGRPGNMLKPERFKHFTERAKHLHSQIADITARA